ncbi:MAG TPA: hypothetical protein PKH07_02040 [bacterium]|nr:hypothetical protein [bacterium]
MNQALHEPIEVLTKFQHGQIVPLRIRWNDRVYNVEKITGNWFHRDGDFKEYFFAALVTGNRLVEIHLDTRDMRWTLDRIDEE